MGLGVMEFSWFTAGMMRVILTVTSAATLGVAVRFYTVWRAGRTADAQLEQNGDIKIRDHYAAELASLRAQIVTSSEGHAKRAAEAAVRYEAMLKAADERHNFAMAAADEREAACHREVRELRDEIRKMADEIIGLRRQLGQSSKSALVLATHAPNEGILAAADRAVEAMDRLEHHPEGQHHGD